MPEEDIYGSKRKYERFLANLRNLALPPGQRKYESTWGNKGKYWCKNPKNLVHFERMAALFDSRDISYIRRNRLFTTLRFIVHHIEKELSQCDREDINQIVAAMHKIYKSPKSKSDFIRDVKFFWKNLFPENDEKGRPDERLVPYVVRHLSPKIDKSQEKLRNDRLDWKEFENLVNYFSYAPMIQFYLTYAVESLIRPQEACYLRLKNIELSDNYAQIRISEHGKEGTGTTLAIDSFPYLVKWLEKHPTKNDEDSFLFVKDSIRSKGGQLTPAALNKRLKRACEKLGIKKNITGYSLKRIGVTFKRLAGYSDMEIQHAARWTSTKQLQIYDLSTQHDAIRKQLVKRGIIAPDKGDANHLDKSEPKVCFFCNKRNSFSSISCDFCKRPLDRTKIRTDALTQEKSLMDMKNKISELLAFKEMMQPLIENFKDVNDYVKIIKDIREGERKIE